MSGQTRLVLWTIEFLSVIAIGILPTSGVSLWWLTVPVVFLLAAKVVEHRVDVRERWVALRQQLLLLVKLLPRDSADVRCTYHIPERILFIMGPTTLRQVFDYLPSGGGGGRRFPTTKGIIGKTLETKGPCVENFSTDAEYRDKMEKEYNYTTRELAQRIADRRSYLCFPIVDEYNVVLGLIYFDSDYCGLFTMEDTDPRWEMIRQAIDVIKAQVLT